MARDSSATRARLLSASDQIAAESGAAGVSLDAVAARAGVSKGGLLYHFPTKVALLRELVEYHIADFETRLAKADPDQPNSTLLMLFDLFELDCAAKTPRAGLLAALAEDPAMLAPVAAFQSRLRDLIAAQAPDPLLAELAFHALQGLRYDRLLGVDTLSEDHTAQLIAAIRTRLTPAASLV